MIKKLNRKDPYQWHDHFVWFPTTIYVADDDTKYRVWWETIERKEIPDPYSTSYVYRLKPVHETQYH